MPKILKSEKLTTLTEILVFVAFALGAKRLMDPVFWRFSGPVTLITTLVLLTLYLRLRGLAWADMGLRRLEGRRAKLMLIPQALFTFAAFAAAMGLVLLGAKVFGLEFMSAVPAGVEDRWGDIPGNLPNYLLWMAIVWSSAAFGEEMFFRGFLITRLQTVFKGVPLAAVLAVVLPALLFGYAHLYYSGLRGLVTAGAIAIAFGTVFLLLKRNLWPIILVHGLIDSINITAHYMGWPT